MRAAKDCPSGRGRGNHAESGEPFQNADEPQIGQPTEQGPNQRAMEYFGKAVAELFDCSSCYVAVMSHASGSELEEVRVGHATIDPSCTTTVARIARKGAGCRLRPSGTCQPAHQFCAEIDWLRAWNKRPFRHR